MSVDFANVYFRLVTCCNCFYCFGEIQWDAQVFGKMVHGAKRQNAKALVRVNDRRRYGTDRSVSATCNDHFSVTPGGSASARVFSIPSSWPAPELLFTITSIFTELIVVQTCSKIVACPKAASDESFGYTSLPLMSEHASHSHSVDLFAIAHDSMIEAGFSPDSPSAVDTEVRAIVANSAIPAADSVKDLRKLLWSSIDNSSSRDLDQVEYAEALPDGDTRLLIGIADVDALVSQGSAIDAQAAANCTSVYTGVKTFPMLPLGLSTDLTSLNAGEDRLAVVTEMVLAPDGTMKNVNIYRALLKNHAKLAYEAVGNWLDGRAEVPASVSAVPGLEAQIRLQFESAKDLEEVRKQHGALELGTIQASPVVDDHGKVLELAVVEDNSSWKRKAVPPSNASYARRSIGRASWKLRRTLVRNCPPRPIHARSPNSLRHVRKQTRFIFPTFPWR